MTGALPLLWASLPLLAAPFVFAQTERHPLFARALDGFVLATIGLLVLLDLLPHTVEQVGLYALLAAMFGLATPMVLEQVTHVSARSAHRMALGLAFVGLALHSAVDGVALATGASLGPAESRSLIAAVVLHQLPVGLAIWWLVSPRWGARRAWAVIGIAIASTALGFVGTNALLDATNAVVVQYFQAYVMGMLLHVMFHVPSGHAHDHGHTHDDDDHDHAHEDHGHAHDDGEHDHAHAHDEAAPLPLAPVEGSADVEPCEDVDCEVCLSQPSRNWRWAWPESIGAALGAASVVLVEGFHHAPEADHLGGGALEQQPILSAIAAVIIVTGLLSRRSGSPE